MKRWCPTLWQLGAIAAGLAAVAFFAWDHTRTDPNAAAVALAGIVALMLLFELPALWWRRRGGGAPGTFAVALAGPLLMFEGWLGYGAWKYRDSGGDLHGIEQVLMVVVLAPILVTAALTAALALFFVEPDRPGD